MTSRKLLKRVLLAAAFSSAVFPEIDADGLRAWEQPVRPLQRSASLPGNGLKPVPSPHQPHSAPGTLHSPGTRIHSPVQQVQYQNAGAGGAYAGPPSAAVRNQSAAGRAQYNPSAAGAGQQPGVSPQAAGNPAVVEELNRLFRENGQQPPSMRPQDLPYATTPQMNRVAAKETPPQKQVQTQPPRRKNLFQKLSDRLRGNSESQESQPQAPKSGQAGLSALSAPAPQSAPSGVPVANSGRAPSGPVVRPNGTRPGAGQPGAGSAPAGVARVPMVPPAGLQPGRGAQVPVTASSARPAQVPGTAAAQASPGGQQPRRFVQPGTAPSFIQPYAAVPEQNAAAAVVTPGGQPRPVATPVTSTQAAAPAQSPAAVRVAAGDDFVNPFQSEGNDSEELLDLDSLIEIPRSREAEATVEASASAAAVQEMPTDAAPAAGAEFATRATVGDAAAQERAETSAEVPPENPFTGVRLNTAAADFSEDTTGRAYIPDSREDDLMDDLEDQPLPPVDEFAAGLPSLPLPSAAEEIEAAEEFEETETAESLIEKRVDPVAAPAPVAPASVAPASVAPVAVPGAAAATRSADIPAVDAERVRQAAEREHRSRQQARLRSRNGQTGFKGFCPVQLRDQRNLADADPAITAVFGLQTYTFSSVQARVAFEADPARYAPAAGGSDVVVLVNSGEEQQGVLDYSLWYRDRLYLFRSRETMELFSQNPARFADQY